MPFSPLFQGTAAAGGMNASLSADQCQEPPGLSPVPAWRRVLGMRVTGLQSSGVSLLSGQSHNQKHLLQMVPPTASRHSMAVAQSPLQPADFESPCSAWQAGHSSSPPPGLWEPESMPNGRREKGVPPSRPDISSSEREAHPSSEPAMWEPQISLHWHGLPQPARLSAGRTVPPEPGASASLASGKGQSPWRRKDLSFY